MKFTRQCVSGLGVSGRVVAAIAAALFAAGCGGGGDKPEEIVKGPKLELKLTASDKLNTCGGEFSNALVVHVFQLASDARISIASVDQLSGNEEQELGDELLKADEYVLEPGGTLDIDVAGKSGIQFVAVVGYFCETQGGCWRWVRPVADMMGPASLTFGEFCIEEP